MTSHFLRGQLIRSSRELVSIQRLFFVFQNDEMQNAQLKCHQTVRQPMVFLPIFSILQGVMPIKNT